MGNKKCCIDDIEAVIGDIFDKIGGRLTEQTMKMLKVEQLTLLAYWYFRSEMLEGGMVQLVHNGYGPFIFENPFAKSMRLWGLKDFSNLIYDAHRLYDKHKQELTIDCSDEEFMALYEQHPEMEPIDDAFVEEEPEISSLINQYVKDNKEKFQ